MDYIGQQKRFILNLKNFIFINFYLITGEQADEVLKILKDDATTYDNYEKMLNERFDRSYRWR